MAKGLFIAIDGCDASGKSTIIKELKKIIENEYNLKDKVTIVREPGFTEAGEEIRKTILKQRDKPLEPLTELSLMYSARKELIEKVIKPELNKNHIVISDRWESSSFVYQNIRGVDRKDIEAMSKIMCDITPDYYIYMDVYPKNTISRILNERKGEIDSTEKLELSYFNDIRNGFKDFFKDKKNCIEIDSNININDVILNARKKINEKIGPDISKISQKKHLNNRFNP